jgi:hypothetical protein
MIIQYSAVLCCIWWREEKMGCERIGRSRNQVVGGTMLYFIRFHLEFKNILSMQNFIHLRVGSWLTQHSTVHCTVLYAVISKLQCSASLLPAWVLLDTDVAYHRQAYRHMDRVDKVLYDTLATASQMCVLVWCAVLCCALTSPYLYSSVFDDYTVI